MARRRGVVAAFAQMQREAERERQRRAREAVRAEREANRVAAARQRAAVQDQKLRDRMYAESRAQQAAQDTRELEDHVVGLQNLLSVALRTTSYVDLEELKRSPRYPDFNPAAIGAAPSPPDERDYVAAAPSGLGRVFGGSKHVEQVDRSQAEYRQALKAFHVSAQHHAERLEEARRSHDAKIARQKQEHQQNVQEITKLQSALAARTPEAVVAYFDLVLESADYPDGFPHSWRLDYQEASGNLEIDYDLPPASVVPKIRSYKYVKSSDTISEVARPVTQVRGIYAEVLRQTALRIVHEVFDADRGKAVRTVVLNGHVRDIDASTGQTVQRCILALATSRERFSGLNLALVDTVACLTHLEARFSKDPSKLLAVEAIEFGGSLDSGSTAADDYGTDREHLTPPETKDRSRPPVRRVDRQELTAGQNVLLADSRVQVELETRDADLSLLLLGSDGRVSQDGDFVFYNHPVSENDAVRLSGSSASIDTTLLPDRCQRVVMVVSAGDGGKVAAAGAVLRPLEGAVEFGFRPSGSAEMSALVWGELYVRNGSWRLRAVGQGWFDGLAGVARDYGVDIA